MITFDFYNHTCGKISKNIFSKVLAKAYSVLIKNKALRKSQKCRIELSIVSDSFIAKINKQYRNLAKPTDVISLSFFDKKEENQLAGEIFVSLPYARKQAKEMGHTIRDELKFLFIHGVLHIFGFKHKKSTEAKLMQRLTDEILI